MLANTELLNKNLRNAKKRVERDWIFWKPIVHGVLTYSEASNCDLDTLLEANVVADFKAQHSV
jgi:hypothetical protein